MSRIVCDRKLVVPAIGPFETDADAREYAAKLNERHSPQWVVMETGRIGRRSDNVCAVSVYGDGPGDGRLLPADRDRVVAHLVEWLNAEGIQ